MLDLFIVFSWFVLGALSAHYAKKRGRNPFRWFMIGLFFGLFGLIVLFYMPNKNKELQAAEAEVLPSAPPEPLGPPKSNKFWYYLDPNNQQFGPMSYDALQSAWKDGRVTAQTYVWNEDLTNWTLFGESQNTELKV